MRIKDTYDLDDFMQMEILEKKYYNEEFITPYRESYSWYLKYPYSIRAVEHFSKILGFMNLFPVADYIHNEIQGGTYNDKYLTVDDIVDISTYKGEEINLFLSCVAIDESARKLGVLDVLLMSYVEYYKGLEAQGIKIGKISTDNVTLSGELFSQKIGFNKLTDSDHGSKIYVGTLNSLEWYLEEKMMKKSNY